ncbi:MAG: hypothetical protein GY832_10200 [Chloroflexi bacterium]|nr:hypothetical protein [Chloroflexota bacterium]
MKSTTSSGHADHRSEVIVGGRISSPTATSESIPYTTPISQEPAQFVTITHPYHPLYGQQVKVIRVCRGADPDITVQFPDGLHVVVAMSWTDYVAPQGFGSSLAPPHLLDFSGLRQTVRLVARMRQEGRYPIDRDKICTSSDKSYD